ncbi:MAG: hypothetical protein COA78_06995 [Blastopirellula sp.]|nr:MAG: hypothetical protein COA78_06995 [Blastopirellula sp.]
MANRIFRGPVSRQPRTVTRLVTGALLPGTFVEDSGAALTAAGAGGDSRLLLLDALMLQGQAVDTAYVSGTTGIAFVPEVGHQFQAVAVAATYTEGQALTTNAAGLLVAAGTGEDVVAHIEGSAGVLGANGLVDIVIANSYTLA